MSKANKNRELYFNKFIKDSPNVQEYLGALHKSPYRTHRRMAVALMPELKDLIKDQEQLAQNLIEAKNEVSSNGTTEATL